MILAVPSPNGLITDLNRVKRGYGLHVRTVQKLNHQSHLRAVLGFGNRAQDFDAAFAMRESLIDFAENCPAIGELDLKVLSTILNFDDSADCYEMKLLGRQSELEVLLDIGRRRRISLEGQGINVLAYELLRS